jgi:cell wall-associated NlpC family hydrolase
VFLFQNPFFAQDLNPEFLSKAMAFPNEGGYVWSSTGCPEALILRNDTLLKKSKAGTYCSGFTFTVFYSVLMEKGWFDSLNLSSLRSIQQDWYGNTKEAAETQCLYVLEKWKWGKRVDLEEAKPGDFVQFWRNNNTGHSALFLGWNRDASGKIVGIRYRSSQKITNGIGEKVDPVGEGSKSLNLKRVYLCRVSLPG